MFIMCNVHRMNKFSKICYSKSYAPTAKAVLFILYFNFNSFIINFGDLNADNLNWNNAISLSTKTSVFPYS